MPTSEPTAAIEPCLAPHAPASLMRRYCSDGSGRLGSQREELVRRGTLAGMSDHLFQFSDEKFETHFIATDEIHLHRDNLLALFPTAAPIPQPASMA